METYTPNMNIPKVDPNNLKSILIRPSQKKPKEHKLKVQFVTIYYWPFILGKLTWV